MAVGTTFLVIKNLMEVITVSLYMDVMLLRDKSVLIKLFFFLKQ